MTIPWEAITDFGDSAITLTLAFGVLVLLACCRQWRQAGAWFASVMACGFGTGLLKLAVYWVARGSPSAIHFSLSGHAALSTMIYGGWGLLIAGRTRVWRKIAMAVVVGAFLLVIGVSRVIVKAHAPLEVVAGFVLGLSALFLFHRIMGKDIKPGQALALLLGGVLIIVQQYGVRWYLDNFLIVLARKA